MNKGHVYDHFVLSNTALGCTLWRRGGGVLSHSIACIVYTIQSATMLNLRPRPRVELVAEIPTPACAGSMP